MHRNKSKSVAVALVAAIGLGMPALAKSTHGGKAKVVASLSTCSAKAQRAHSTSMNRRGAYRPLARQIRHSSVAAAPVTTPTFTSTKPQNLIEQNGRRAHPFICSNLSASAAMK
jgi:hypothetical protein